MAFELIKVSELPELTTPSDPNVMPIQDGDYLKRISIQNLKEALTGDIAGDLEAETEAREQAVSDEAQAREDADDAILADLAAPYDATATYAVGDYCTYEGQLQRCIVPIETAEEWTAAHWTAVALGADVSDLKSDLNSLKNLTITSLKVGQLIEGEGILAISGDIRTGATFTRTDYIDVSEYETIVYSRRYTIATGGIGSTTVGMAFYNESKEYISGQYQVNGQSENHYVDEEVDVPATAKYARFTLYANSAVPYSDFHIKALPEICRVVLKLEENNLLNEQYNNLYAIGTISEGYVVNASDASLTENSDYDASDFIPVSQLSLIYGYGARYWFYDADKVRINEATGVLNNKAVLVGDVHYVKVPTGAVYFRICINKAQPKILYARTLYEEYLEQINSDVSDIKMYCLGDSITRGMYAEIGTSSSTGPTSENYPYWIGEVNNYEVVNLGNSGSGWANVGSPESQGDPSTAYNAKGVIDNNTFEDADIITLAFGVNDWKGAAQNVVLGDMTSVSGDGTVIGNMKYCIETLADPVNGKAKQAQIIVLLPLNTNRQWTGMDTMTLANNWAFGYAYRNGQTLEDYRDAIRECAEHYNLKVIDLEEVCPINRLNIRQVLGDGLHPTQAFYKQMGMALAPLIH